MMQVANADSAASYASLYMNMRHCDPRAERAALYTFEGMCAISWNLQENHNMKRGSSLNLLSTCSVAGIGSSFRTGALDDGAGMGARLLPACCE